MLPCYESAVVGLNRGMKNSVQDCTVISLYIPCVEHRVLCTMQLCTVQYSARLHSQTLAEDACSNLALIPTCLSLLYNSTHLRHHLKQKGHKCHVLYSDRLHSQTLARGRILKVSPCCQRLSLLYNSTHLATTSEQKSHEFH